MQESIPVLLTWYDNNKRDLPWRKNNTPYHVWISEIMLQQTRIEAVINYYHRFIKELPDITSLANVEEDKLLKLWEGLGYYNRARNLKKCAIEIMNNHNGTFPTKYTEIKKLPGIGEYTASAISSICFNEKQSTIDGNVLRVYTRVHNDPRNIDENKTKKFIHQELLKIIPKESGKFNQALMELGETICIPKGTPKCEICPLSKICLAKKEKTYLILPTKNPSKEKIKENYTVLIYKHNNKVAIYKRKKETILTNLWAFPMIDKTNTKSLINYLKENKINYRKITKGPTYTHIFTHKKWEMNSYIIEITNIESLSTYNWVTINELEEKCAIPGAFQPFKQKIIKQNNT